MRPAASVWSFIGGSHHSPLASASNPWQAGLLEVSARISADGAFNQAPSARSHQVMDWRRDGEGLRYVHQFGRQELEDLADKAGFDKLESFSSDGETGDLGLYMVWVRT